MPSLVIDYSYWWLALISIIAGLYSFVLYRKDKNLAEISKPVLYILRGLRFVTIFTLLFLLLNPLLKTITKYSEKPVIAILQDNSLSLINSSDSIYYKTDYIKSIEKLVTDLSVNYKPVVYTFGEELNRSNKINYSENKTDIVKAIKGINNLYINRNLGAIILASDGIYNTGINPKYYNSHNNSAIYTLLLGDTSEVKDVLIKNIVYNNDVFLGNNFPLEVTLNSVKLQDEKAKVKVLISDKIIAEKEIVLSSYNKLRFNFKAEKKGLVRYKIIVELSSSTDENSTNNTKEIIVNVIDSRKKILLLANSPHPDVYAIKTSLAKSNFYSVEFEILNESVSNLKDYDLVIFHQLPSVNKSISEIVTQLNSLNISSMYIVGAQTNVGRFNKLEQDFKINLTKKVFEETAPEINSKFSLFSIDDSFNEFVEDLPPLISYFADYTSNAKTEHLFTQKIRNIVTDRPLLMFSERNAYRSALISGEGIWRWKINDYKQNGNFNNFNTLINKTVQYLTANIKDNPLVISHNKVYQTNEDIVFNASFVNKSFELINTSDLIIEIFNSEGTAYNYSFDRYDNKYRLQISEIEEGDYSFKAKLKFGNMEYISKGAFSVLNKNLEYANTVANHNLLREISNNNNGASYYSTQFNDLKNRIEENQNIAQLNYYQTQLTELINSMWIFLLIIFAISIEWFVRKYSGSY